jgi:hypothetical protein
MKDIIEGFNISLEMAMEFYQECADKNLTTPEERTALLREFVAKKQAIYIRDVEAFIGDKRAIQIRRKKDK